MELKIVLVRGEIIEHDHGAVATGEEMLQGQDLPPVAKRALREEAQFRQAVEDNARRVELLNALENEFGRFAQLHLGWMEDSQLALGIERRLRRYELE